VAASVNITLVTVWYEEKPGWLYELVASVAGVCNRVVAVDGAYALFPNAKGGSLPDQAEAIVAAVAGYGLDLTLYQPAAPWHGNEVEKRNYALSLANAEKPDWVAIIDGDERIVETPPDLFAKLEATDKESVMIRHRFNDRPEGHCKKLYRAPVRIGKWHAEYLNVEGIGVFDDDASSLWLDELVLEHRKTDRDPERQAAASRYYQLRDEEGIEPRA
jgi:hypothetical protein